MQPDEWQSIFSQLAGSVSGGCFTNNLRAFQNNFAKIHNTGNHIYVENLKKKLCTCAQSHSSGTRTQFQLEILIRTTISAIHKFQENIFESSRNVSETTPRLSCPSCPLMHGHSQSWVNSQEVQGLLINSLTIDRCIKTATTSCLYSVKLLWGGCQQSGCNIGNDLAPTGSVSNTVWNILGEFQQS